ncbi:MAG: cytochrome c oxidase subunit II [Anaerolineae bacterium]
MHIDKYEKYWIIAVSATLGVFMAALIVGAIVFGVRVSDTEGFVNPNRLDDTIFANPGVRDMGNNVYEVTMVAQMWSFNPAQITVPVGAQVDFMITSRDVTHGFIIEHHNVNFELVPGQISRGQVTFRQPGEYRFICHEYCGQLHHIMHGVIIVEEETVAQGGQ